VRGCLVRACWNCAFGACPWANHPLSWTFLCVWLIVLLAVQFLNDFRRPLSEPARTGAPAATLFLIALSWALVQLLPGVPQIWAHPAWSAVPEAQPRISADPGQGAHHVMRLAAYGRHSGSASGPR
jgi:hypothetical protein